VPQFRGSAGWDKTLCLPSFLPAGELPEMIRQSYGSCRLRGEGWSKPRRGCILLPGNHSHFPTHRAAECSPSLVRPLRSRDHRKPNLRRLPRVPKCQGISHKPARPGTVALPCLAMRPTSLGGEFRLADGFIFCEAHPCPTSQNYSKRLQSLTVQTVPSWFHRFWKTLMPG